MTLARRVFLGVFILALVACRFSPTPTPPAPETAAPPVPARAPTATPQLATTMPTLTATALAAPTPSIAWNAPGDHVVHVTSSGQERDFVLHVPPGYEPGIPLPLVINLHGLGSNARQQERLSQMSVKADEEGFIVVYPQATGAPAAWHIGAGDQAFADAVFLRDLIDFLEERMSVDPARVYVTGFSNGGGMANRLGCLFADRIAAIAPVSGAYLLWQSCRTARPLPVLAFHGTADAIVPYDGDAVLPAIPAWAAAWAERDGCDPEPSISLQQGSTTGQTWGNCQSGSAVTLYTIEGGGHRWPGLGQGLAATNEIWAFFLDHSLPQQP